MVVESEDLRNDVFIGRVGLEVFRKVVNQSGELVVFG